MQPRPAGEGDELDSDAELLKDAGGDSDIGGQPGEALRSRFADDESVGGTCRDADDQQRSRAAIGRAYLSPLAQLSGGRR
jgi:hypothetical protein